jgi:hypothetical protein
MPLALMIPYMDQYVNHVMILHHGKIMNPSLSNILSQGFFKNAISAFNSMR